LGKAIISIISIIFAPDVPIATSARHDPMSRLFPSATFHVAFPGSGVPPNTVNFALETAQSGLGQNARTTGGAGSLAAASLREVRLGRLKLTALGVPPAFRTIESPQWFPSILKFNPKPNTKLRTQ
jgi:hypothetical protein